jgi:hypothetical protein
MTHGMYEGELVKRQQMEVNVMDVIGFLCLSLGISAIKLRDSLGIVRTCACSEAGFNSQNGDRA